MTAAPRRWVGFVEASKFGRPGCFFRVSLPSLNSPFKRMTVGMIGVEKNIEGKHGKPDARSFCGHQEPCDCDAVHFQLLATFQKATNDFSQANPQDMLVLGAS